MDIYVMNQQLETVGLVEHYESAIWTKRYSQFGDCEIYLPANTNYNLQRGNILRRIGYDDADPKEMYCIITRIELTTDEEQGDHLIVTGQDIRSLLDRRIIWNTIAHSGTVEGFIRKMLNQNIISPENTARRINNFTYNTQSETITDQIKIQATYDQIGEQLIKLSEQYHFGSFLTIRDGNFVFGLYRGAEKNVMFSPEYDNLISSDYIEDEADYKNCALIGGEGEGSSRILTVIGTTLTETGEGYSVAVGATESGLDRRELFIDAKDIRIEEGQTSASYEEALAERGAAKLAERGILQAFDGAVVPDYNWKFGVDYDLGDIVTVRNTYGMTLKARVTEVIECHDQNGYSVIPTIEKIEEE